MAYAEFIRLFSTVYICNVLPSGWHTTVTKGAWGGGLSPHSHSPQFVLAPMRAHGVRAPGDPSAVQQVQLRAPRAGGPRGFLAPLKPRPTPQGTAIQPFRRESLSKLCADPPSHSAPAEPRCSSCSRKQMCEGSGARSRTTSTWRPTTTKGGGCGPTRAVEPLSAHLHRRALNRSCGRIYL
jgi:hypothetical protein